MTSNLMRAVTVGPDLEIRLEERARPLPLENEVVIAPGAGGICGTDIHIVRGEFPQTVFPVVPCHEFAGTIVAVGRGVEGFQEGDLVTVDPNVSCGTCRWCLASRPNLCVNLSVIGVTRQGGAAEQVAVPARSTFRLPKSVDAELGAMVEPLACACNAIYRAGPLANRRILVIGSGVMGLLITIAAKRAEPSEIWVSDPARQKHAIARAVGADLAVTPQDLEGEKFDIVFEASGSPIAAAQVMALLNPMGIWMQVGVLPPAITVPLEPFAVFDRELSIIGSNSLADKFPAALDLMPEILTAARHLVTHHVSVWDFKRGIAVASGPDSVKTQLTF